MGGLAVQAFTDHPAYFTMLFYPAAQEFGPGVQDEIAFHLLPYELKFVMVAPDIVAGAGDDVLAGGRDKDGRAWHYIVTDIAMLFENTHAALLAACGNRYQYEKQQYVDLSHRLQLNFLENVLSGERDKFSFQLLRGELSCYIIPTS
jgi:hypothetical protein